MAVSRVSNDLVQFSLLYSLVSRSLSWQGQKYSSLQSKDYNLWAYYLQRKKPFISKDLSNLLEGLYLHVPTYEAGQPDYTPTPMKDQEGILWLTNSSRPPGAREGQFPNDSDSAQANNMPSL